MIMVFPSIKDLEKEKSLLVEMAIQTFSCFLSFHISLYSTKTDERTEKKIKFYSTLTQREN